MKYTFKVLVLLLLSSTIQGSIIGIPPEMPVVIIGPTEVCYESDRTYRVTPVSGATSYQWTLPNGWTGSSTTESIHATPYIHGGIITVRAVNACGQSEAQSLDVMSTYAPDKPGPIQGETTICAFSDNTFSVDPVDRATEYSWDLPKGWSGSSTTETIIVSPNNKSGTILVQAYNYCGESSYSVLEVTVKTVPEMPDNIMGKNNICKFSTQIYSVDEVDDATSYTWDLPNGWTGYSTTESISVMSGEISGEIIVSANNECGASLDQTLFVEVSSLPPTPGKINGNDSICPNSTNTYSIAPVIGATSYTWTLPNGWTGISDTESITTTSNEDEGNIMVVANNDCGSSSDKEISVSINTVNTDVTQSGPTLTADLSRATYQWIDCENNDPISGATEQTYNTIQNGDYAVIITENNCTDTSTCYNVTSTDIDDYDDEINLQIMPNPTNGVFRISGSNSSIDDAQIEIYNSEGIMIYKFFYFMNEINLSDEPKDVYFIRVVQNDVTDTKKLIIR